MKNAAPRREAGRRVVACGTALAAWPFVAWKRYAYGHALSLVPAGLDVRSIRFEATEFMGFGPGGSEAGLLLYDLPEKQVNTITASPGSWCALGRNGTIVVSPRERTAIVHYRK